MTLTAVLLTGGESRRMGREKATIVFQGQPLWQRQIKVLRELDPKKVVISARVECSWRPAKTELLLDEPPSRGPISGLTKALERMRTSHLAVLAIDMPFITGAHLQFLWSQATSEFGVVPMIGERAEPLAAIYPKEAHNDFADAMQGSDSSLQPLIRRLACAGKIRLVEVTKAEAGLYRSLNEPDDLSRQIA